MDIYDKLSSAHNNSVFVEKMMKRSFTFTHELSGINDENAIEIKNLARVFKDTTTDAFMSVFLSDSSSSIIRFTS
jgi:hypothetical protein